MMEQLPDNFKKVCATAQIICASVVASTLVLAVVVEIVKRAGQVGSMLPPETASMVRMVFYVIVFGELMALQVLRKILLSRPQGRPVSLDKLQTSSIVTSALCESIAIFGLVMYFIGGFYLDFYIFLAAAIALQLFYFPRQDSWKMFLEAQV